MQRWLVTAKITYSETLFFESMGRSPACSYIFIALIMFNSFEPTIWAIFRGIITMYSCVGLVVFSGYSVLAEARLRGTLTAKETISVDPNSFNDMTYDLSIASVRLLQLLEFQFSRGSQDGHLKLSDIASPWSNPTPELWTIDTIDYKVAFDISFHDDLDRAVWIASSGTWGARKRSGITANSTQVGSLNPLVLASGNKYDISLIGVGYIMDSLAFTLWVPGAYFQLTGRCCA